MAYLRLWNKLRWDNLNRWAVFLRVSQSKSFSFLSACKHIISSFSLSSALLTAIFQYVLNSIVAWISVSTSFRHTISWLSFLGSMCIRYTTGSLWKGLLSLNFIIRVNSLMLSHRVLYHFWVRSLVSNCRLFRKCARDRLCCTTGVRALARSALRGN